MSKIEGIDSAMAFIQDRSLVNSIDYQFVMDCLKDFRSPRSKLSHLLHSNALIRVKKGLYLLGHRFKHTPYCFEMLANLIYGPSYVSLERALQIYGMIPEHVENITSVTKKGSKDFRTPVGTFIYAHCHKNSYSIGITTKQFSEYENPLIATPEKAITDMLTIRRGKITSMHQVELILIEDLRIEEDDLTALDLNLIRSIRDAYPHSSVYFLEKWLTNLKT
ncbi:MAG: hypothetical protein H0W88_09445 [Parachlamydiaceae bacterium]|nr:hypothetical protein [Parachlamydiaceae bacterium]